MYRLQVKHVLLLVRHSLVAALANLSDSFRNLSLPLKRSTSGLLPVRPHLPLFVQHYFCLVNGTKETLAYSYCNSDGK